MVDSRTAVDVALGVASIGLWVLAYGVCLLITRPASPRPAPATPDLGAESPALVSLLVNRWTLTEDAAESTLLDLAARRFVELRQPGDEPMQTTVHLPRNPPDAGGLRPYENQVLDRIHGLAVDGVVPLSALTFRDNGQAKAWDKRLRAAVVAEARRSGLSRRRFGPGIIGALVVVSVISSIGVLNAAAGRDGWLHAADDDNPGLAFAMFSLLILAGLSSRSRGERDTAAGRAVAARWLGVRNWLRGHPQFADLPPASVAVWDRYLAYGAAVGVTHLSSAVLDLGMGNRRLVWSSYGGTWHRVRVWYPKFWPRYGRTVPVLLLRATLIAVAGAAMVKVFGLPGNPAGFADDRLGRTMDLAAAAVSTLGVILLLFGVYTLVRGLLDLVTEKTITGEVLWLETWRSTAGSDDEPTEPWLHYLAVDDGSDDRTTAWGLPSDWSHRCHDGDTVTVRVRPWSRRVLDLRMVGHGRSRRLTETITAEDTGNLALDMLQGTRTVTSAPQWQAVDLFTAADVGRLVGRPVVAEPLPMPGPMAGVQFRPAEGGRPLLLVQAVDGLPGRVAWRANQRGLQVPGIADGAYASGPRAAFRQGDTTVVVTLLGDARAGAAHLPWLLGQAATALTTGGDRSG